MLCAEEVGDGGGMGGTGSPKIMGNPGIEPLVDEMIVRIDMFLTLMCVE